MSENISEFPSSKKCGRCLQFKSFSEYAPSKKGRLGLYNYCHRCALEYQRKRNPKTMKNLEKAQQQMCLFLDGLKECTLCRGAQTLDQFYADERRPDGKQSHCRSCWAETGYSKYIRREYGISEEDYQKLLDTQGGVCAICKQPPLNNRFNIDHCHATHRIRALLCVNCNTNLLPYVEYSPDLIERAFSYLKDPPAFQAIGEKQVPETNQSRSRKKKRSRKVLGVQRWRDPEGAPE